MRISILSLGCSKNTVDSEKLAGILNANGINVIYDSLSRSDVVIINTCGFILDAQQESIDTILDCIKVKSDKRYKLKKIYVFGCLVVRNKKDLQKSLPEVDGWFGVNDIENIAEDILKNLNIDYSINNESVNRKLSTLSHYAYLKIAEGCNKYCSFCAIPYIRGEHVSRSKVDIIKEAEFLAKKGVRELILISQDLTYYGYDLYNSLELCDLIKSISSIGFDWIRLHYAHPNEINDKVLNLFNTLPNLCKYLDIPLQHVSSHILKSMKRNIDKEGTNALIKHIREVVPDIAIRTSLIVGYPSETDKDFDELIDFVKKSNFERLGVFTYSAEKGTNAYRLNDDVSEAIKEYRKNQILEIQKTISYNNNSKYVGKKIKTLIDFFDGNYYIGRSQYDSPEVDQEVIVSSNEKLKIGEFYNVQIKSFDDYDLIGEVKF